MNSKAVSRGSNFPTPRLFLGSASRSYMSKERAIDSFRLVIIRSNIK